MRPGKQTLKKSLRGMLFMAVEPKGASGGPPIKSPPRIASREAILRRSFDLWQFDVSLCHIENDAHYISLAKP